MIKNLIYNVKIKFDNEIQLTDLIFKLWSCVNK